MPYVDKLSDDKHQMVRDSSKKRISQRGRNSKPVAVLLHATVVFRMQPFNSFTSSTNDVTSWHSLADLGGHAGHMPTPPLGTNSFVLAYIFAKKHLCRRSTPPYGKSWIRHWH